MRAPTLLSPVFCINSLRLFAEMVAAKESLVPALSFAVRHLGAVVRYRFSPVLMARRVRLLDGNTLEAEVTQLRVPALIITGQAELDRVVPVALTRDYLRLWPPCEHGHHRAQRPPRLASPGQRSLQTSSRDSPKRPRDHDQRRRVVG